MRLPMSTRADIIDGVINHIKTSSTKPRDMVRTLIGQLVSKGKLKENNEGGLTIAKEE